MPRPAFDDLPDGSQLELPYKSAWGLYGPEDELGTLNLLTSEAVRNAVKEVQDGVVVPLNLPLNVPSVPMNPARTPIRHNIIAKGHANDDEIHINTQSSTHWDGLRHYPYQTSKQFYNHATQADIDGATRGPRIGIQGLSRKGIVARGVLLDFRRWAASQNIAYNPFTTFPISVAQLQAVAKAQDVVFQPGDILIIRSGWVEHYQSLSGEEQVALGGKSLRTYVGVEQSEEMLRFVWDNRFAAVAGDTNAFESWPPTPADGLMKVKSCHEVFLSGWGMPIGELWDLEALARTCEEKRRYSFMVTSQPLNLPAGVASPANVMAIL